MLDAFKGRKTQEQAADLEALINTAREERKALSVMLTQVTTRSVGLTETARALDKVDQKAAAAIGSMDGLAQRLEALERRAEGLTEIERRVKALTKSTVQFVMQDAQNTLRMLSHERELAERIEESIRQLRSRTGGASDEGRQTA
jgi:septal ring factor EnvC (AmiA/AmiB activator)